jgi:polysaccharide biosynthesis protein PslH
MTPLRIVIVMIEPPVPFGNAAARWFYVLLKGLVQRGHSVTALAACSKAEEVDQAKVLFPAPTYDLRCYPLPRRVGLCAKLETLRRPYSYMFSRELRGDLEKTLAQGFDILHLEQLWSGWLGLPWRDRALVNVHYLFSVDLESVPAKDWGDRIRRRLMLRGERVLLQSYLHVRTLSERLERCVSALAPHAQVYTSLNCLEPALYSFISDRDRTREPVVSVIGSMGWSPSRSAAERLLTRLWPHIKRSVPQARLQVVGWNARTALRDFLSMPDVRIEENVPDIHPYFERTCVLLYAPGRGSGVKVKVQEALAYGVPVVTTHEGVEGMPAEDGVHAGVCDDDSGLIERTVRLLRDPEAANRQRAEGRRLMETTCGPKASLDALEAIYACIPCGTPLPRARKAGHLFGD